MLALSEDVESQVLCLDSRKVHERARSHGEVLAHGIDEMPVTFEGKSFDVQADQLRLFRFQSEGLAGENRHSESGKNGLPDRLVGVQLHAYLRGQATLLEQLQRGHARS